MDKPACPGHRGKCRFCKSEHGYYRYIAGMLEVKRNADGSSSKIIDLCCKACKQNDTYARENYDSGASARFGYKMPRGDEV